MKILVLGSGGREHALAWKLGGIVGKTNVFLHPGNAATGDLGYSDFGSVALSDRPGLIRRAQEVGIGLVVIGPETLLCEGYADFFRAHSMAVVGPNQLAARLESSKVFAKQFMDKAGVPTAEFSILKQPADLESKLGAEFPIVLKLDGLAAGKGVVVAQNEKEARAFAHRVWETQEFGPGPHQVLLEHFLPGNELSYMGLCDGKSFVTLSTATDYKRVGDEGEGPNTGGMGAVSPSPYADPTLEEKIQTRIVKPILRQMQKEKLEYRGVLYVGLMISPDGDPFVLEFNARFGDPETQAVLLRAESDLLGALSHTAHGTLNQCPPLKWRKEVSLYVVAAAEGYPATPRTGDAITGVGSVRDVEIFFSGVEKRDNRFVTAGGRVLGVGALADTIVRAREKAYDALERITWRGMHYRSDIGL